MQRSALLASFGMLFALAACSEPPPDPAAGSRFPTRLTLGGGELSFVQRGDPSSPTVLLLHGARFTWRDWERIGTLDVLADAGYSALALDLPGFGESEPSSIEPEAFLGAWLDAFDLPHVVLVTPSMSGNFGLPFAVQHPDRLLGYVALAPAGLAEYAPRWPESGPPTLAIWGSADRVVPPSAAELLVEHAGAELHVLEGAGHPCYLDRPERFHELLLAFLSRVTAS